MGETQTSHNWRGNGAFSKPRPSRDEAIDDMTGTIGGESCGAMIPIEPGDEPRRGEMAEVEKNRSDPDSGDADGE